MANSIGGFGFLPSRHMAGGLVRYSAPKYRIASATANTINSGDPVTLLSTGLIARSAGGDADMIGIFYGVQFTDGTGAPRFERFWLGGQTTLASVDAIAYVYDDPNISYFVKCKTGTAMAQTHIGNNADFEWVAGVGGASRSVLDISAAGSGTANFRIMQLAPSSDNDFGDSAVVEVRFNEHKFLSVTGI